MGRKRDRKGKLFYLYLAVVVMTIQLLGGCTTIKWALVGQQELSEAKQLAGRGDQPGALKKYKQIQDDYPEMGDRALFWTGILYAKPRVGKSDYSKSRDAFQALLDKYPDSDYKEEARIMVDLISELRTSQKQTDAWERKAENMKRKIEQMKAIDRDEELKKRRLKSLK